MRSLSSSLLVIFLAVVGIFGPSAGAQERNPPTPPLPADAPPQISISGERQFQTPGVEDGLAEIFQLVDQYLISGQMDRAVALMEDTYAQHPTSFPVFTKLKQVYTTARKFDEIVDLLQRRISQDAQSTYLLAELGFAFQQAGRSEEAAEAWASAVVAAPDAEMTYRNIANQMGQARLYEDAAAVLLQGRSRLEDLTLYQAELANLFGLATNYEAAANEYLALLVDNPQSGDLVRARITRLIDADGAADAFSDALARAVRRDPLNRAYRELSAWISLERGDFPAALDANIAIDRLQGEQGQSLYGFAEAAATANALDEARRALEIIIERHGSGPIAPYAYFSLAELSVTQAEESGEHAFDSSGLRIPAPLLETALEAYTTFPEHYPHHPRGAEAIARAAELQQTAFRDYEAAESLLRYLLAGTDDPMISGNARLDLGRVAMRRGDLQVARTSFTHVEEALRIGPLAEEARIELAKLDFYEGDFEGALARVDAMNQNTATDVANDAISLKLLLRENTGPDSLSEPLRAYALAALMLRQQRSNEALGALNDLLSIAGAHPISDEAAFLRIQALRDLQRPDEALAALIGFPARYPDSYLVERTVFLRGEVYERDLGDASAATEAYAELLVLYPGSLLAPEARARLRRLRGDRPIG